MAKKNIIRSMDHQGCRIDFIADNNLQKIEVDGKAMETNRDGDTGNYGCEELPYQRFGTLEELGKAYAENLSKSKVKK